MDRLFLASFAAGGLLAIALAFTLVLTLKILGEIYLRSPLADDVLITDEGPALHQGMPMFSGQGVDGRPISLSDFAGRSTITLFVSVGCAPCKEILGALRATKRGLIRPPDFLVVFEGPAARAQEYVRRYRLGETVIVDEAAVIRRALGIERVPYSFYIDRDGVIRMKGVTNRRQQLEGLIAGRGTYLENPVWQPREGGLASLS
jgi:methylamine dehydrogenase accessory protein MauD